LAAGAGGRGSSPHGGQEAESTITGRGLGQDIALKDTAAVTTSSNQVTPSTVPAAPISTQILNLSLD
jgi:hypothetical protein